jgi:hypothetical protein
MVFFFPSLGGSWRHILSRSSWRLLLRLQAAGWRLPTMVLSETRGLWLSWVVRGGIRCPMKLRLARRGLNPAWILTLEPERSVAIGRCDHSALPRASHALKLLVTSNGPRRTLLLSSRSSAQWRRSCAPASAAPSPAACFSSVARDRTLETLPRRRWPKWPRP